MDRPTGREPAEQPPSQPELRLAVAMRGGVSLAIWMGGACLEIDRLRRSAGSRDDIYGELLRCAGYTAVVVDVLAGTSAGGLNAVLLGCSLAYDMRFDCGVRDLWLRVADIQRLSRRPQDRLPRSVLKGDEGFYQRLLDGLGGVVPGQLPTTDRRVDLILTGTLFEPRPDTFHQRIGQAITDTGSRARFRFRQFPELAALSDFHPPDVAPPEPVFRLAYAARSTSSYPGAFEPARICAGRDDTCSQRPPGLWPFPRTMYGVFSESSSGPSEAKVIDGGVLDNIPIGWAVRSIAAARANQPVDRWLLYLQPVPPAAGLRAATGRRETRPGLLTVIRKAHDIKLSSESLLDDVDDLSRYEAAAAQRRRLARTLALTPLGLDELLRWTLDGLESYRRRQGEVEAARQARLLEEPAEVTGPDPLPFGGALAEAGREGRDDAVVAAFLAELRRDGGGDDLVLAADATGCGLLELARRLRSPYALARTVATLLDWTGRLARQAPGATVTVEQEHGPQRRTLGEFAEQNLYHLRFLIEVLVAARDRLVLRGYAHLKAEETPESVTRDAAAALDQAVRHSGLKDDPMSVENLSRLCDSIAGESGPLPPGAWPEDGLHWLWALLADQARWLAQAAATHPELYPYLQAAASQGNERMLEALVAMEVLFGPLRPDPLSETAAIQFHMVSAANLSPFDSEIFGDGPRGADKLAGNQLNNFAAFLSARWRHNDWIWGRLDAARSLVELVARGDRIGDERLPDLRRLAERLGASPGSTREQCVEAIVRRLHAQVLAEELPLLADLEDAPPPTPSWRAILAGRPTPSRGPRPRRCNSSGGSVASRYATGCRRGGDRWLVPAWCCGGRSSRVAGSSPRRCGPSSRC
jgi:patatin-related protein